MEKGRRKGAERRRSVGHWSAPSASAPICIVYRHIWRGFDGERWFPLKIEKYDSVSDGVSSARLLSPQVMTGRLPLRAITRRNCLWVLRPERGHESPRSQMLITHVELGPAELPRGRETRPFVLSPGHRRVGPPPPLPRHLAPKLTRHRRPATL